MKISHFYLWPNSKTLLFSDFFPVNLVKLANPGDVLDMCFLHSLAARLPREMHKSVEAPPAWGTLSKTFFFGICNFSLTLPCLELWHGKGSQISLLKKGFLLVAPWEMTFVKIY